MPVALRSATRALARTIPHPALLFGLLALGVLLAESGQLFYLWVFPLDGGAFSRWMALAIADVGLANMAYPWIKRARLLLWTGGILFFTAGQGAPFLGLVLITLPVALWVSSRTKARAWWLVLGVVLTVFGHMDQLLHPGLRLELEELRLSIHLLGLFFLFRGISWSMEVFFRGEEADFFRTMEFFLAPAFWLSPMHANTFVWSRMSATPTPSLSFAPMGWILRGLTTALFFTQLYAGCAPWLEARFSLPLGEWLWWQFPLTSVLLFVLAYLEKSRVSYLAAGFLRLAGHEVEPDFRAPWAARDLLDFWRRFHYWVLEFYRDCFYGPLSVLLSRRISVPYAVGVALFLTFVIGTTFSHFVWYPGPFTLCLALGILFGAATLLHYLARPVLRLPWLGIPLTWVTVLFLYFSAYPVFGLGWDWLRIKEFFGV